VHAPDEVFAVAGPVERVHLAHVTLERALQLHRRVADHRGRVLGDIVDCARERGAERAGATGRGVSKAGGGRPAGGGGAGGRVRVVSLRSSFFFQSCSRSASALRLRASMAGGVRPARCAARCRDGTRRHRPRSPSADAAERFLRARWAMTLAALVRCLSPRSPTLSDAVARRRAPVTTRSAAPADAASGSLVRVHGLVDVGANRARMRAPRRRSASARRAPLASRSVAYPTRDAERCDQRRPRRRRAPPPTRVCSVMLAMPPFGACCSTRPRPVSFALLVRAGRRTAQVYNAE